jgi:hypothetical protein
MSKFLRKHQLGLAVLTAALAAAVLYWPSLGLPLVYDDLLHIRIVKGLNLATVWRPTEAFGFYRPLTFFPLLVIHGLFGYYPAWLLHGLNVAQHALNAALLVALSWRLWRKGTRALMAGLLLALFPFAYQAVAVYGHNVHPATAGLMLLGLHTYLSGIEHGKKRWWLLTGLLFLLGLLSHETAILFGPFAALVHWNYPARFPRLRTLKSNPWFVFLVLGGLYALIYQALPLSRTPQGAGGGVALWPKVLYLLQAATYPYSWLAHLLPEVKAATIVLGGLAVTLGLTAWSARRRDNRLPLLLGWGWWGLASSVIALSLPTDYLLHGPRLLYLGGIGLALLWPLLLEPMRRLPKIGDGLWITVVGFILLTGWQFVRHRLADYVQLTSPVILAQDVMAGRPPDEGLLLVNLPAWLSPSRNTYPLGVEFVSMLADYLFVEELVVENLGVNRPVQAIKVPDILSDPGYPYAVYGESSLNIPGDWAAAGSQVFITYYTVEGVRAKHTGQIGPPAEAGPPLARFGPYELLAADVTACEGSVRSTLRWGWTQDRPPPATTSLFVQLLDDGGRLIAQADAPPLGLRPDLILPVAGWQITDLRTLQPTEGRPAQLLVGVYDYLSGERFPAQDAQGQGLPGDALTLPVEPCP